MEVHMRIKRKIIEPHYVVVPEKYLKEIETIAEHLKIYYAQAEEIEKTYSQTKRLTKCLDEN